jgi:hypothetical protein
MTEPQHLVRDEHAGGLLEMMLVFAVVTILGIRAFLALTGYPQLGGGNLHIAHTLWGGLGMLVAIALLLNFWNPPIRQSAAVLGGIGFGFFIDELGKFITTDVDYFFKPTIALLYIIFIILFLATRAFGSRPLGAAEITANRNIIAAMSADGGSSRLVEAYARIAKELRSAYLKLVSTRWFAPVLSTSFIVIAIGQIITIITLVTGNEQGAAFERHVPLLENVATFTSALFIVLGVIRLRRSRLAAYRWFQRATLVSILVTQVFMFYYSELAALGGLLGHVLVYFALRFVIDREKELDSMPPAA